jgi:hypothetical protein
VAWAALVVSIISLLLAAGSVFLAWRRTRLTAEEAALGREARVAVRMSDVRATSDSWEVDLTLTNVGRDHARRTVVWLVDAEGNTISDRHHVGEVLAGQLGVEATLRVPSGYQGVARPVRSWRDGLGDRLEPSTQTVDLSPDSR